MTLNKLFKTALIAAAITSASVSACTTFVLNSNDDAVVYGRTMEWGAFDLNSRLVVVPRGYKFAESIDGYNAIRFQTQYGIVGIDAIDKDFITDGMNEKGLVVGVLYHPNTAEYQEFTPDAASKAISSQMLANYILGRFETVEEVAEALKDIIVVDKAEEAFSGYPLPLHWTVVDANNNRIVVEYLNGELSVFENPLGVMTNSPSFDWHMTNVRNYPQLQREAHPSFTLSGHEFTNIGGGTNLMGIPGDYTPPSRFIRAVAYSQTAKETKTASDAVLESFRILDSFNLPLGSAEGGAVSPDYLKEARSSTMWTTTADATNLKYYYHTQYNRQIRMIDLMNTNFSGKEIKRFALDESKEQPIIEIKTN
ncbi:choloylglycine hydrolase family protein [Vibrio aestuarianus]|uniref:linear amide C-N hydrolase n=1 Tax=Vibrio aestuarianus TaxID=28171 RepID=UPI0015586B7B|nr:choloylglycine hydrolase family protein [Vibrio aestuarianus]NGZ15276.1 choloylglycine hydrolase family protein [Vibrio aestuarianus]NKZ51424.1 choloylglycine hydrolase family protein [Vibrio aestuarianus]